MFIGTCKLSSSLFTKITFSVSTRDSLTPREKQKIYKNQKEELKLIVAFWDHFNIESNNPTCLQVHIILQHIAVAIYISVIMMLSH